MKRRRFVPKVKSTKKSATEQRASKGSAYIGDRAMFEGLAQHMYDEVTRDPKNTAPMVPPPSWDDVAYLVEDGEVGVFIRSEPCGTGYAVTMRCARPSDIRSGAFYKQLAAYDQENGITVLDDRCPMAVNVLPLAKIAELRRMTGDYATSDAVPLDDFIVNGEVGIAVYAEQMPLDDARDNFRMELQYMTPAEARELARRWRQS